MGETVEQLEAQIDKRRAELDANLDELERSVKLVMDWRYLFRTHPLGMLGVAFGGGFLLAGLTSRSHQSRRPVMRRSSELDALDHIKGALIGVATTRLTNFIAGLIPGFSQHLQAIRAGNSRGPSAGRY
jgi:hypothetical protein